MAKPRFSLQQHQDTGKALKEIDGKLSEVTNRIHSSYPKNDDETAAARKATDALRALMSKMDDAVCLENPSATDAQTIHCYLGSEPPDPPNDSK